MPGCPAVPSLPAVAWPARRRAGEGAAFDADAALVNFYASKDTLGGHKDDAEADLDQPLVSLSLGCPAVFLLGGETKETAPAASD